MRKETTSPSIVGHALGMTKGRSGPDKGRRIKAWETGGSPWWIWNQQREYLSGDTWNGHKGSVTESWALLLCTRHFHKEWRRWQTPKSCWANEMDRCWDVKSDIIPNSECRYSPVVLFCFVGQSWMQDLSSPTEDWTCASCWCLLLGKWVLSTELPEKYLLSCLDSRESRI